MIIIISNDFSSTMLFNHYTNIFDFRTGFNKSNLARNIAENSGNNTARNHRVS